MNRRHFLSTVGAGTATGVAGCTGLLEPPDSPGDGPPRLGVDGRWLTDPDGNRVVLRGVNVVDPWWGTTYDDLRGKDYWETLELATDASAGWHAHAVRIPVEPRSIREAGLDEIVETYLDRIVEWARERGVYVVVDYHAVERYDTDAIDRRLTEFWDRVAPRYADETHVLYELFNEPTQPAGDGIESWRTWQEYARPWIDRLRSDAPETPIVVGSPRWSSMTRFAATEPFDDDNLVYTAHVFPSWDPESWEPNFGDPALDVPVFVTEWGYVNVDGPDHEPHMMGSTEEWGEPFRQWLDAHENVSWTAWTFDSHWKPSMFDEEWNLLGGNDYMGEFVRDWLAETRTAHWPPGRPSESPTPDAENEPPSSPANLRVTDLRLTSIEVAWDPATDPDGDGIVQYRVAINGEEVRILRGSGTSVTLSGLEAGETHEITVTAVDGRGLASATAATTSVTTPAVTEPVATIPHTSSPPTVDGAIDDSWDDIESHPVANELIPVADDSEFAAEWRATWDESALYYLVTVTDPDAWADSEEKWQNDNVEIYLDPDNSRERRYDGENDAQLVIERGDDTAHAGANSVDGYQKVRVVQTETDDGYRVEVAIPWSETGVTPAVGHQFGTDVHAIDDVDGGERDAKRGWFSTTDDSWENPQEFAVVALGE